MAMECNVVANTYSPTLVLTCADRWPYRGFDRFPAHFFGANSSGTESAAETRLIAKHQFAGWGWQQAVDNTSKSDDGNYYSEETSLAQAATRLATFAQYVPCVRVQHPPMAPFLRTSTGLCCYEGMYCLTAS